MAEEKKEKDKKKVKMKANVIYGERILEAGKEYELSEKDVQNLEGLYEV
ncbi:MAG: hypothetical protein ABDH28_06555 [Brevinematia bacterium]